jgi:hypothetical protein
LYPLWQTRRKSLSLAAAFFLLPVAPIRTFGSRWESRFNKNRGFLPGVGFGQKRVLTVPTPTKTCKVYYPKRKQRFFVGSFVWSKVFIIMSMIIIPIKSNTYDFLLAEREGFEPSSGETPEPDFESGAFDHSAIFPLGCRASGRARQRSLL